VAGELVSPLADAVVALGSLGAMVGAALLVRWRFRRGQTFEEK
jgi:hypothetical protein